MLAAPSIAPAQWLGYPTPGIPRLASEQLNLGIKLAGGLPYTEWSKAQMVQRRLNK